MKKSIVVMSSHTPSLFWFRTDMMIEFIKHGYSVYAFGNESSEKWHDKFQKLGIEYRQISVRRNGMNPFQDKKTFDSIKDELRKIKPDKIFTYQAKTVIYGTLAANDLDIYEVYPLIAGMGSAFLSDSLKMRMVRFVMTHLYRRAMKNCPTIFFQNVDDEKIFKNAGIVTNQNVVMIHGSGVNVSRFELKPLPDKISFICVSRLIKDKGVIEYLEACKMIRDDYPEVRCMLVGPFDTNPSALKQEDINPYIECGVEYFGEQDDIVPYLAQASVFVLPSYREGTPKTNLEAMSCGRAVITTDAPGCRETVVDGKNGFLVPIRNSHAVYEKMKWFIEHPREIDEMGKNGRIMVEEVFDVNKVNESICRAMDI